MTALFREAKPREYVQVVWCPRDNYGVRIVTQTRGGGHTCATCNGEMEVFEPRRGSLGNDDPGSLHTTRLDTNEHDPKTRLDTNEHDPKTCPACSPRARGSRATKEGLALRTRGTPKGPRRFGPPEGKRPAPVDLRGVAR